MTASAGGGEAGPARTADAEGPTPRSGDEAGGSPGQTGAGEEIEIELKYDVIDPTALEAFLAAPTVAGLPGGQWREVRVEDRYVDTADRAVERHGYAARIRERDGRRLIGLKSLTPPDGALHRREEIEGPAGAPLEVAEALDRGEAHVPDEGLDPAAWPQSPARDRLREMAGDEPLHELFVVRQQRRVRVVSGPEGSAELSLDEVEVVHDGARMAAFPALEVELRDGGEALLRRLAAALEETGAVRSASVSKYETARRLVDRAAAAPVGPAPSDTPAAHPAPSPVPGAGRPAGVTADDLFAEAGRRILRFQLARLLAAEEGTRSGTSASDLHKMRVATRRMRAAWRTFGDAYRPGRVRRSVRSLRLLGRHLGMVRDLDVLLDSLAAHAARLEPAEREALAPLARAWHADRDTARAALTRYLESRAYRRLTEDLLAFAETPGQDARPAGPTDPRRVREMVPSRLWAAYGVARAYDGVLRWADLATLHQLRIAVKRLRDATDSVRDALGPDVEGVLERLVAVQDHLGALHDADVASGLARTFLVEHAATLSPDSANAVGTYLAAREREVTRLRRTMGPAWRRVTALEFRRALGRAVAHL